MPRSHAPPKNQIERRIAAKARGRKGLRRGVANTHKLRLLEDFAKSQTWMAQFQRQHRLKRGDLSRWRAKRDQIARADPAGFSAKGGARPDVEDHLRDWVKERQGWKELIVTSGMICAAAEEYARPAAEADASADAVAVDAGASAAAVAADPPQAFKADKGWCHRRRLPRPHENARRDGLDRCRRRDIINKQTKQEALDRAAPCPAPQSGGEGALAHRLATPLGSLKSKMSRTLQRQVRFQQRRRAQICL